MISENKCRHISRYNEDSFIIWQNLKGGLQPDILHYLKFKSYSQEIIPDYTNYALDEKRTSQIINIVLNAGNEIYKIETGRKYSWNGGQGCFQNLSERRRPRFGW